MPQVRLMVHSAFVETWRACTINCTRRKKLGRLLQWSKQGPNQITGETSGHVGPVRFPRVSAAVRPRSSPPRSTRETSPHLTSPGTRHINGPRRPTYSLDPLVAVRSSRGISPRLPDRRPGPPHIPGTVRTSCASSLVE